MALVQGFFEDAPVELQPTDFTVEIEGGRVQIDAGARRLGCGEPGLCKHSPLRLCVTDCVCTTTLVETLQRCLLRTVLRSIRLTRASSPSARSISRTSACASASLSCMPCLAQVSSKSASMRA